MGCRQKLIYFFIFEHSRFFSIFSITVCFRNAVLFLFQKNELSLGSEMQARLFETLHPLYNLFYWHVLFTDTKTFSPHTDNRHYISTLIFCKHVYLTISSMIKFTLYKVTAKSLTSNLFHSSPFEKVRLI